MTPSLFQTYLAPARARPQIWRLAAGLALIFGLYLALGMAVILGLRHLSDALLPGKPGPALTTLTALMTFPPLVAAVLTAAWILHRRRPGTLLGMGWPLDFLRALAVMALIQGVLLALGAFAGGPALTPNLAPGPWLRLLPLALLLIGVQTLSEELLFRAYLLQQLAVRFRSPFVWYLLPALLFGAAHASPQLAGAGWPVTVVAATIYGLVAGDLVRRHGNLGAAWGLHFAINAAALLIVAPKGQLSGLALWITPLGPEQIAAAPWLMLPELLPLGLAWFLLRRPSRR